MFQINGATTPKLIFKIKLIEPSKTFGWLRYIIITKIIGFGFIFLILFTGLGWAILSLIYTWLRLKITEIKEGVFSKWE